MNTSPCHLLCSKLCSPPPPPPPVDPLLNANQCHPNVKVSHRKMEYLAEPDSSENYQPTTTTSVSPLPPSPHTASSQPCDIPQPFPVRICIPCSTDFVVGSPPPTPSFHIDSLSLLFNKHKPIPYTDSVDSSNPQSEIIHQMGKFVRQSPTAN